MVFALNGLTSKACFAGDQLQQGSFLKREVASRFVVPFTAVALVGDASVRVLTGAAVCVLAALGAVLELAKQTGMAALGVGATVGALFFGVVYPPAAMAMCRALGLAEPRPAAAEAKPADLEESKPAVTATAAPVVEPKIELTFKEKAMSLVKAARQNVVNNQKAYTIGAATAAASVVAYVVKSYVWG